VIAMTRRTGSAAARWWRSGAAIGLALVACQSAPPAGAPPSDSAETGATAREPEVDCLATFDVRFPWAEFQWVDQKLDLTPDHTGSESWADHLGLAGYNDNSIKRRRRAVMNVLTFGLAQRWYDARGLGSPPD
jgi:hypothetical protein